MFIQTSGAGRQSNCNRELLRSCFFLSSLRVTRFAKSAQSSAGRAHLHEKKHTVAAKHRAAKASTANMTNAGALAPAGITTGARRRRIDLASNFVRAGQRA